MGMSHDFEVAIKKARREDRVGPRYSVSAHRYERVECFVFGRRRCGGVPHMSLLRVGSPRL